MKQESNLNTSSVITSADYRKMQGAKSYQALGRLKSGQMNKTEAKYAAHLEARKAGGSILWYAFEPANLRLGEKCFYKVDFLVLNINGMLEVHEVKGSYVTDDALVKLKVAAERFPFKFIMAQYVKGNWQYRDF